MHRYSVYGACLESAIEFPELRPATHEPARWRFLEADALPPMRDPALLGDEPIYGTVHARLYAHGEGHRITVDDTGTFDLARDGTIRWERRDGAWPDFVRAHCIGRVLATLMFLDGWLPLHGSAAAVADGVVAFLAPKGFGKSSLALALSGLGARLVTDDTLPVDDADPPRAWPGVLGLRLRDDALAALGVQGAGPAGTAGEMTRDGKRVVALPGEERAARGPLPLAALYLLDPTPAIAGAAPVSRTPLAPTSAALVVTAHVKIGRMLGAGAAPTMLARAARVVRTVPVHRLTVSRDFAQLPEVAATILRWHGGAGGDR